MLPPDRRLALVALAYTALGVLVGFGAAAAFAPPGERLREAMGRALVFAPVASAFGAAAAIGGISSAPRGEGSGPQAFRRRAPAALAAGTMAAVLLGVLASPLADTSVVTPTAAAAPAWRFAGTMAFAPSLGVEVDADGFAERRAQPGPRSSAHGSVPLVLLPLAVLLPAVAVAPVAAAARVVAALSAVLLHVPLVVLLSSREASALKLAAALAPLLAVVALGMRARR